MPQAPTYRKCILHVKAHGHLAIRIAWPPTLPRPHAASGHHIQSLFLFHPTPHHFNFSIPLPIPSQSFNTSLHHSRLSCKPTTSYKVLEQCCAAIFPLSSCLRILFNYVNYNLHSLNYEEPVNLKPCKLVSK